jgi:hypothetical protein
MVPSSHFPLFKDERIAYVTLMAPDSQTFILISAQQARLEKEVASLEARLSDAREKLTRINITMQVLSELPGFTKEGVETQKSQTAIEKKYHRRKSGGQTITQMVVSVLKNAQIEGLAGLEPRDIFQRVSAISKTAVRNEGVGSTAWRLWKDGVLQKEGSLYKIPKVETPDSELNTVQKIEATGDLISRSAPMASEQEPQAQGGEARPGGGT